MDKIRVNSNPEKLPYGEYNMVAPFWSDIDLKGTNFADIFYHLYDKYSVSNTSANEAEIFLKSAVSTLQSHNSEFENFTAATALLVTWDHVNPYPAITTAPSQNTTFQLLLVTDGDDTYAMYIYGDMGWTVDAGRIAVVGWQCGSQAYRNNPFSETTSVFRINEKIGNMGNTTGAWYYKLGHCQRKARNPALECVRWYQKEEADLGAIQQELDQAYSCPCSYSQLQLDRRFSVYRDGCFYATLPRPGFHTTATRRCCYNSYGSLEVQYPSGGHFVRHSPFLQPAAFLREDVEPRTVCCDLSDLCGLYLTELRPPDDCHLYQTPTLATYYGDPHLQTMDGLNYTFNGLGEYVLFQVEDQHKHLVFEIQARTASVSTSTNNNATIFTAVVVQDYLAGSSIQAELSQDKKDLLFYNNGNDISADIKGNFMSITNSSSIWTDGLVIIATLPSGVSVNITHNVQMLDVALTVPSDWRNNSDFTISGLLGNFNGDLTDDFTLPNGTTLSHTMHDEAIFHKFGEKWRTVLPSINRTNVFKYNPGRASSFYQHPEFLPLFLDTMNTTHEAEIACGRDDLECIYDYVVTGDATISNNTKYVKKTAAEKRIYTENHVPRVISDVQVNATVGKSVTVTATALDDDIDQNVTLIMSGSYEHQNMSKTNTSLQYVFTPDGVTPFNISFHAVDSAGGSSPTLQVRIVLCPNCSNNGNCYFLTSPNQNFLPLNCECPSGWLGSTCDIDFNGCQPNPCPTGTNCTDLSPAEQQRLGRPNNCTCREGFSLSDGKCTDIDECHNDDHGCNGTCHNTPGSYYCTCDKGYVLSSDGKACRDINECDLRLDNCDQKCNNTLGGFQCACHEGYNMTVNGTCKVIAAGSKTCAESGLNCSHCLEDSLGARCYCPRGLTLVNGTRCQDIDECSTKQRCDHTCSNIDGGFLCSCAPGYTLQVDKTTCKACTDPLMFGPNCSMSCAQCQHLQRCDQEKGCICEEGYTGSDCSDDIDECQRDSSPCSDNYEQCVNTIGSFICDCKEGYYRNPNGSCQNIDECTTGDYSCEEHASCHDNEGSYTCVCDKGFSRNGTQCKDIDECTLKTDNCVQDCENVEGSFNCLCHPGYVLNSDGFNCTTDVEDPCPIDCGIHAVCNASGPCVCERGYDNVTGICEKKDPCSGRLCTHGKCDNSTGFCQCHDGYFVDNTKLSCIACHDGTWGPNCTHRCTCGPKATSSACNHISGNCTCSPYWTGPNCTTHENECDRGVCGNGTCTNTPESYNCSCREGYSFNPDKRQCEDIDECTRMRDKICLQNSSCDNTDGGYVCKCHNGFQLQSDNVTCVPIPLKTDPTTTSIKATSTEHQSSATSATSNSTSTTKSQEHSIALAVGLGVGIPLLIIFVVVVGVCLYRRRGFKGDALVNENDPYNVRPAFGSLTSALRSHGRRRNDDVMRGMYNKYYSNWGTPGNTFKGTTLGGASSPEFYRSPKKNNPLEFIPHTHRADAPTSSSSAQGDDDHNPARDSNFSWDFLYQTLKPEEDFRLQRPVVSPAQPSEIPSGEMPASNV
ncbi:mucin-like protein [Haliotis rubra]|uniref:mucin-like protein n=1 Tax=Haliotis rubra TaxID=36100 RepID=UPI001EE4ECC7|nr:mucin-like protein [Haliotis rubra]